MPKTCDSRTNSKRRLLYIVILAVAAFGCSAAQFMPSQDCGAFADVSVNGIVQNGQGVPISGAEVVLLSKKELHCPNSVPIDDVHMTTDDQGRFTFILPVLTQDDTLEMTVEASGYSSYTNNYVTYEDFKGDLVITLQE
jgi:hypothetical protein